METTLESSLRAFSLSLGSQMSSTSCSAGESARSFLEEAAEEEASDGGGRLAIAFHRFHAPQQNHYCESERGNPCLYTSPGRVCHVPRFGPLRLCVICLLFFFIICRYGFCLNLKRSPDLRMCIILENM